MQSLTVAYNFRTCSRDTHKVHDILIEKRQRSQSNISTLNHSLMQWRLSKLRSASVWQPLKHAPSLFMKSCTCKSSLRKDGGREWSVCTRRFSGFWRRRVGLPEDSLSSMRQSSRCALTIDAHSEIPEWALMHDACTSPCVAHLQTAHCCQSRCAESPCACNDLSV